MTTKKFFPLQGRRRGVTLIESVLFVSIGLGLIVGGIVFFQQANDASRTNDVVRNISNISNEVRAFYRTQPDFTGLNNDVIVAAGVVPKTLTVTAVDAGADTIANEFAGTYAIAPGSDTQTFVLTTTNVPQAVCTRIATKDASGNGPVGAFINSISITPKDGAATSYGSSTTAVTAANAAAGCSAATNAVAFTFSR